MYTVDWSQFVDVTHCTAKYVAEEVPVPKVTDSKFYTDVYLCTFIDSPTGSGENYYATQVLAKKAKELNKNFNFKQSGCSGLTTETNGCKQYELPPSI